MANDPTNTADRPEAITVALADLPSGLRGQTIADASSDARHLEVLIDDAFEKLTGLILPNDADRASVQSAVSLLWVARDLAETLGWKLERIERAEFKARAARQ